MKKVIFITKIKECNHHFFDDAETRTLNPMIAGIVPKAMKFGFCVVNAAYMTILFRNRNFNVKTIGVLAAAVVAENSLLTLPNYVNESIQNARRAVLAR